jgi:diguanylate cyclase (GGDEF)-like protein
VGLLDLDHFKEINDSYSHAIGDQVLCKVAELLNEAADQTGLAARMGGEEFLLVFEDANAADRFERLRQRIENYGWGRIAPNLTVTISIGATKLRQGRLTQSALLGQADRNLYAAKSGGRNRLVFDPD